MQTVSEHTTQTFEEKRSKFIAHLFPYEMFDEILETLRAEHPKARHFVTAFRHLNAFDQVVEGCSDDGEPKGTSGKPTLAVLQGHELINIGMITVRYFGGIKLGTGGLVRAYGDAANLVIDRAELLEYHKEYLRRFSCSYPNIGLIEYEMQQHGLRITDKEFGAADVIFTVSGTRTALEAFFAKTERLVDIIDT